MAAPLPLEGIRVLDMGVVLAGPQATVLLADLGAEVIRIESTGHFPPQTRGLFARPSAEYIANTIPSAGGYPLRQGGERAWNRFAWFNTHARNKMGITVDLKKASGKEIFKRLAAITDVIIINQTPGTLSDLGIGYEVLSAANPALIVIEATSFGASGPYSHYKALGLQMEAFAGHDLLRHYRDRDVSSNTWAVTADAAGALGMALAAQMALYARKRTGKGQYVDLSMVENFVGLIGTSVLDYTVNGRVPGTLGNRDYFAIQGCYPCAGDDRWLVLTLPDDAAWEGFCRAAGEPAGCHDARFATPASRYDHHDDVDALIAGWSATLAREEAVARLRAAGLMAGPVLDDADVIADPHLNAREYFLWIAQDDVGMHLYPGFPYRFRNAQLGVRLPPVRLGEHNEYVYKTLLGVTDDEYRAFEAEGHVGMEYAPHIN